MNPKQTMQHIYLFTLEILPLETGKMYNELPSHLTLMSRFATDMSSKGLRALVQPLFDRTSPIVLEFGPTTTLGPKKTRVHMATSAAEQELHIKLHAVLESAATEFLYPKFIGAGHKAHVSARDGVVFEPGSQQTVHAVYLIEVVNKKRLVCAKLAL